MRFYKILRTKFKINLKKLYKMENVISTENLIEKLNGRLDTAVEKSANRIKNCINYSE